MHYFVKFYAVKYCVLVFDWQWALNFAGVEGSAREDAELKETTCLNPLSTYTAF